MKTCTKCKQEKPLSEYHNIKRYKNGKLAICKICHSKYCAANYDKHHTRIRKDIPYRWKNGALGSARQRSREKSLPFDIVHTDLPEPTHCPALGIELDYRRNKGLGQKGRHDGSAELDRTIPEKGYVKGNINVLSARANKLKNNGTIEEFEKILAYLKSL